MLKECHLRVMDQCATLQRLAEHLSIHQCDQSAAEAATAIIRYFDLAAPNHHADEEDDLMPALFDSVAGSDAVCLRGLANSLYADHKVMNQQWLELRSVLFGVIERKRVRLTEDLVFPFIEGYRSHIAFEEKELFPMAERLLTEEAIEKMGQSMRRRRGG